MFGAIAGGIASALAGGAMSKLFGGGQKAASGGIQGDRSEERRVGKECRSRWFADLLKEAAKRERVVGTLQCPAGGEVDLPLRPRLRAGGCDGVDAEAWPSLQ